MNYNFDDEVAAEYGVSEAVFIHNLYWWIRKNEANGRHYYDGRSWTYNSMRAFAELFPFWTERQIRTIIEKLQDKGAIHIANYNQRAFDRTQWYALDESVTAFYETGTSICLNRHTQVTKSSHPNDEIVRPIPDSKPDSKPDINADILRAAQKTPENRMPEAEAATGQSSKDVVIKFILNNKSFYPVLQTDVNNWADLYPNVDIMQQLRNMAGWLDANPDRRKTKSGIKRFINNWLAKEQNSGKKSSVSKNNTGFNGETSYDIEALDKYWDKVPKL